MVKKRCFGFIERVFILREKAHMRNICSNAYEYRFLRGKQDRMTLDEVLSCNPNGRNPALLTLVNIE